MSKRRKSVTIILFLLIAVLLLVGIIITNTGSEKHETIKEVMRDAVLHESGKISFLGIKAVNPAFISGVTVTVVLLIAAACIRIFVIPKFKYVPGKFQLLLEEWVGMFDSMAKSNSPHRNGFLGAYIFSAGSYIFVGTLFELFGLQGVTTEGHSIALPAPLSDINAAIAMGCLSYLIILSGGIVGNGFKGVGSTLKDFSLPISMSFRLFGALLSGLLVTELVYYYIQLSFVFPVVVGVLFTLLHALIQTYVLTMLTALFYGEVSEPHNDFDEDLFQRRVVAKKLFRAYNKTEDEDVALRNSLMQQLFKKVGKNVWIEPDFKCEFGKNITIEDDVYINFGCVILDCAEVTIGSHTLLGPNIGLYAANHSIDATERINGGCYSKPIHIGKNVWLGGDVKVLPGVTIGDNTIIGTGSIVTKDIPSNVIAVGNPCKVLREITDKDKTDYLKRIEGK